MAQEGPKGSPVDPRIVEAFRSRISVQPVLERIAPKVSAKVLNSDVIQAICGFIEEVRYIPMNTAAMMAGVPKGQFEHWWQKAVHAKSGVFRDLREAVEMAKVRGGVVHRWEHTQKLQLFGTVGDYEREGRQHFPEFYEGAEAVQDAPALQVNVQAFFEEQRAMGDIQRTKLIYAEMARSWEEGQPALPENTGNSE